MGRPFTPNNMVLLQLPPWRACRTIREENFLDSFANAMLDTHESAID
jgi:hypothetical protein